MLLSDSTIKELIKKEEIIVKPFDESLLSPSSLDIRLGDEIIVFNKVKNGIIDVRKEIPKTYYRKFKVKDFFILQPQQFILAHTLEYIKLPSYISARLEGRSSLARLGLIVHSTGGFIDAGFKGQITLEMTNLNKMPIKLYPKMKIAQIAFEKLDKPAENPYDKRKKSKYLNQRGPTISRIHEDF